MTNVFSQDEMVEVIGATKGTGHLATGWGDMADTEDARGCP